MKVGMFLLQKSCDESSARGCAALSALGTDSVWPGAVSLQRLHIASSYATECTKGFSVAQGQDVGPFHF